MTRHELQDLLLREQLEHQRRLNKLVEEEQQAKTEKAVSEARVQALSESLCRMHFGDATQGRNVPS